MSYINFRPTKWNDEAAAGIPEPVAWDCHQKNKCIGHIALGASGRYEFTLEPGTGLLIPSAMLEESGSADEIAEFLRKKNSKLPAAKPQQPPEPEFPFDQDKAIKL